MHLPGFLLFLHTCSLSLSLSLSFAFADFVGYLHSVSIGPGMLF